MRGHWITKLMLTGLAAATLTSAACGTVATPEWAAEAQETRVALAATDEHLTAIAPTATPIPPTATPTPVPPTATPIPPTAPPTEVPTATPEAAPTTEAAVELVMPAGDPVAGQTVFVTSYTLPDGQQWACAACHSVTPDELRLIGPGLWNVGNRALTYPADAYGPQGQGPGAQQAAAAHTAPPEYEYIRSSIINPARFIAPVTGGQPGWALAMPLGFGDAMTEQEINDVIAYLLTLR